MTKGKLFGGRPVDVITVVDPPVSQWYVRRARVTFLALSVGLAVTFTSALSMYLALPLAIVAGTAAGVAGGAVAGAAVLLWPVARVLWWWSLEMTVFGLVVIAPMWLTSSTFRLLPLLVDLVLFGVCTLVGPVRRRLAIWLWVVADRHLLRSCFARLVRGSGGVRPGSLPLVLWAKPTPAGERVWLWLRPGLELADLDGKTGRMAVACGAKQIRVVAASERYAALIRVDVARRDPLSGRIDSPLALLIPGLKDKREKTDEQVLVPLVGLDLADIEEPADPQPRSGRR
jgi:hypothetical protein